jgi:phage I-like protein
MNATILNRAFQHPADGWYHIEPRGEHPNHQAGVVQVIDEEAVKAIVNRFNADADAGQLSHGAEMLIDHEHFSHDTDKETRAFGWLNRLQARADGIYGQVRWSATGKQAVDGGDYRFFSTEYDPQKCAIVNRDSKRLRPLALCGLTLTNRPNNRGGKPITNRDQTLSPEEPDPTAGQADKTKNRTTMKLIAQKLGLSADASEDAILGELAKIQNRAIDAEGKLTPLTAERDLLKNRVTELLTEQIDGELATAGITDETVIAKLKPVLSPMKNRAERVEFIGLLAKGNGEKEVKKPLTNRADAKSPTGGKVAGGDDDKALETKKAHIISNRAAQIVKDQPGVSQMGAFVQAQRAVEGEIASGVLVLTK